LETGVGLERRLFQILQTVVGVTEGPVEVVGAGRRLAQRVVEAVGTGRGVIEGLGEAAGVIEGGGERLGLGRCLGQSAGEVALVQEQPDGYRTIGDDPAPYSFGGSISRTV
jgi:hypothetical protein